MKEVEINTEYIKLDQFLKWVGYVNTGSEAKDLIIGGFVNVNNEKEDRRGRKLYKKDIISVGKDVFTIK